MLKFTEMLWYTGVKSYYNNLGGIDVRKEKKYGYTICIQVYFTAAYKFNLHCTLLQKII